MQECTVRRHVMHESTTSRHIIQDSTVGTYPHDGEAAEPVVNWRDNPVDPALQDHDVVLEHVHVKIAADS
eukprot:365323-Chlamydomonas_euryale.AAC.1